MKTYKTWEAIKMLTVNLELRFKDNENRILSNRHSALECMYHNRKIVIDLDESWTLIQQSVTFMEATKAFISGQNVRVEYASSTDGELETVLFSQADASKPGIMKYNQNLTFYVIENGNWFIEEVIE